MQAQGNLHHDEELGRAKRNLLWFCSAELLLRIIKTPSDGTLETAVLWGGARIDVTLLRFAIWLACLYCWVGFYRQIRNVDRLNSEAIYTVEFENIRNRLSHLHHSFDRFCQAISELSEKLPAAFVPQASLELAEHQISAAARRALINAEVVVNEIRKFGIATRRSITSFSNNWDASLAEFDERTRYIINGLRNSSSSNEDDLLIIRSTATDGQSLMAEISAMRIQFNRLSAHIRNDHRLLYIWYDKYLSYFMVIAATIAAWWNVLEDFGQTVGPPIAGFLSKSLPLLLSVIGLIGVYYAERLRTRLVKARQAKHDESGSPAPPLQALREL